MPNEFEKALKVISKPPDKRRDEEIRDLVPWLRSKAKLFKTIKANILADIIRNCRYATKERDEIVIKQGDVGDCFYITLNGKVSIYIFNKDQVTSDNDRGGGGGGGGGGRGVGGAADQDDDESDDVTANMIHYNEEGVLERSRLGNYALSLGAGTPFGDVALTSGDSIRTASIVADQTTDLLVVDRALYNRSVKEVLAKEFLEKTTFIKNNPLFSTWPAKYRKQLAMALYKETFGYESTLARQGDRTSDMYFILSGQVEIQMDTVQHRQQYPKYFQDAKENVVDRLLRKAPKPSPHTERNLRASYTQQTNGSNGQPAVKQRIHSAKRRDNTSKCLRLCHLGVNESIGDVELTMSLTTYLQTAVCRETTEVLVLEGKHYDRLFVRRHPRTIETMRDQIGVKLESRLAMIHHKAEVPFFDHLQSAIASRHKPAPQLETRDEPSVSVAEREFLNHKGPLIDQHGPGSVFYLIKQREISRMRMRQKRGERMERIRVVKNRRHPSNTMLQAAANKINSIPQESSHMRPVSSIGGYDVRQSHHALSYRGLQNAWRDEDGEEEEEEREENERERERRLRDEAEKEEAVVERGEGGGRVILEENGVMDRRPGGEDGEGVTAVVVRIGVAEQQEYHHQQQQQQQHPDQLQLQHQQQNHHHHHHHHRGGGLVEENEEEDVIHSYRSLSSRSPELEGAEEQDARLSFLEEKVRRWLQADTPKGKKAHVAQLRRLPIEEMDYQPRPGNKVYVRRRDNRKLDSQNTLISSYDRNISNMTPHGLKTNRSNYHNHNNHNSSSGSSGHNLPAKSPRSVKDAGSIHALSPRVKKTSDLSAYNVLLSR